mgnify:CR=1 FL=1
MRTEELLEVISRSLKTDPEKLNPMTIKLLRGYDDGEQVLDLIRQRFPQFDPQRNVQTEEINALLVGVVIGLYVRGSETQHTGFGFGGWKPGVGVVLPATEVVMIPVEVDHHD